MTTIKYTGKHGEYIAGIPARNLTDEDWSDLTKEQRKAAIDSGLYVKPEPEETKHEPKKPAKEETPDKPAGG